MARVMYRLVPRPVDVTHRHPVLVFDGADRLHLPLTMFVSEATRRLSAGSVDVYLYALLPFFTFLDSRGPGGGEEWAGAEGIGDVALTTQADVPWESSCLFRETHGHR
jgi:hypothetical protein